MIVLSLWRWGVLFAAGTALLIWAGVALARAGDEIATRFRLGGLVVGMLLMAAATSLPEIVTDVSAVVAKAPDLALGDLFGSSMANMAILGAMDLIHRRHVWVSVELGQARVASIAIALTALAVVGMVTPEGLTLGWVGFDSLLIVAGYVAAMAWIRRSSRRPDPGSESADFPVPTEWGVRTPRPRGPRSPVVRFALAAAVVLVSAPVVAVSARGIADATGVSETFVGVLLLAAATSLPELVASLAALRLGAYDLAVGNLFGSNAFNMVIVLFVDVAHVRGPILTGADPGQIVAGVGAIGLMAVALAAIVHGEETRIARLEPDAFLLLACYVGAVAAVWAVG